MIPHVKVAFVEYRYYKYLGITLDNNLNFQKQMSEVSSVIPRSYILNSNMYDPRGCAYCM